MTVGLVRLEEDSILQRPNGDDVVSEPGRKLENIS